MKKTLAALALVSAMLAPVVSMAAGGDYQSYTNTYPVTQSSNHHVNNAE